MLKLLLSIFLIFNIISFAVGGPQTTIAQGILEGKELINENGKIYHSYSGIPYAKPPLGNLRFKPPEVAEPWAGVRNATEEGNACRSKHFPKQHWIGDEDCLFLNVYSPQTASHQRHLPVMVWIHGGGFVMGSGNTDMYGPDWLMDYDVTLVTFNYRLGPLGFLSLDIEEAPGNVGMLDQVAVLRWVQENIAAFGGDPDNVTIFGESAGGASVHYLMLSDTARGLFHKAIAQSGVAFSPWGLQVDHLKNAFEICEILGLPTADPKDALEFLQQVPVDDLMSVKRLSVNKETKSESFVFAPSIERTTFTDGNHQPFMTQTSWSKMKSGNYNQVPLMIGQTDAEGLIFLYEFNEKKLKKYNEDPGFWFVPQDLKWLKDSSASLKLADDVKKFYFKDEPISVANLQEFVNLMTDIWFRRGIHMLVKLVREISDQPVFLYEYSFDEYGIFKSFIGSGGLNLTGASHCDELGYLFKNDLSEFPKDKPNAVTTRKRLLELWTNFAKTGNPTPEVNDLITVKWEPVTKDKLNCLTIGKDFTLETNPKQDAVEFWESRTNEEDFIFV